MECYSICYQYCHTVKSFSMIWCNDYCIVACGYVSSARHRRFVPNNCVQVEVFQPAEEVCIFDGVCYDVQSPPELQVLCL